MHLFVHADGVLGLVEHRLVFVGVLLTGSLVHGGLATALLAVWNDVTEGRSVFNSRCKVLFEVNLPLDLVAGRRSTAWDWARTIHGRKGTKCFK